MSSHSSPLPALGSPDPRHVVVISSLWASDHAVYRTNARFVEALAGHYRLTLVTNRNPAMETSGFERVIRLGDDGDPAALAGLDARVAFFPDVGMGEDSMRLANTRLAPIQVMSCGHPVSTFGAEIDYFISGDEVDDDDTAARFYSERLVLIPGRGVVANRIVQPRRFQDKPEGEAIRIGLPWSVPKINRRMLAVLRSVADRCRIPVEFHLFSGVGLWKMGLPPFRKALEAQLGDGRVVLYPYLSAEAYLESLSHMHMAADSHPFGGFNTVVDCLHSGIPMVGFEGERAFSRYGPHLMRGLGLGELVATDHQGFADILVHLIDDAAWRSHWEGRVRALDLDATVYAEDNARHFRTAMDYLVANHETLTQSGSRAPIRIRPMTG